MSASASTVILTALTRLATQWSSPQVQAQYARSAGIRIDPGDIPTLYVLGMQGSRRAASLADELGLTRPTMSKKLQRLEAAGFIARSPDPADGRAATVSLSESGKAAYDALVARGLAATDDALREWAPADRALLADLIDRFVIDMGVEAPVIRRTPADAPRGARRSHKEE